MNLEVLVILQNLSALLTGGMLSYECLQISLFLGS